MCLGKLSTRGFRIPIFIVFLTVAFVMRARFAAAGDDLAISIPIQLTR
jgi:hypothetical protein